MNETKNAHTHSREKARERNENNIGEIEFISIHDILMPTANTRHLGNSIHARPTFANRFALNMNSNKMGEIKKHEKSTKIKWKERKKWKLCMKHEQARKRFHCIFFGIDFFLSVTYSICFFIPRQKTTNVPQHNELNHTICALLQPNKTIMTRNGNRLQQRNFKGPRSTSIFFYFVCLPFNPFSEATQWGAYRLLIKIQSITSSFHGAHTNAHTRTPAMAEQWKKAKEESLENDDALDGIEFGCLANVYRYFCESSNIAVC